MTDGFPEYGVCQRGAVNSLMEIAFCEYCNGDTQKPQILRAPGCQFIYLAILDPRHISTA